MEESKIINSRRWDVGECCVVCGSPYVQGHHVFFGVANRRVADKYGYVIPLCAWHHTGADGIHQNREYAERWMRTAQQHYERHIGSRKDFIEDFGRSYL